jgi:hypothetical protein
MKMFRRMHCSGLPAACILASAARIICSMRAAQREAPAAVALLLQLLRIFLPAGAEYVERMGGRFGRCELWSLGQVGAGGGGGRGVL